MRNLAPFVKLEGKRPGVIFPAGERLRRHQPPFALVQRRETRVALVGAEDPCEVELPGQRQRRGVDLRPADDEHLLVRGKQRDGLLQRMDHRAAGDLDILARDDDVRPVGKRTPERLPGFAAHDDRMARGHGLEMPEVLGNVPQQGRESY